MITKQEVKSRAVYKLTFELSKDYDAETVALVGSFNGWKPVPFNRLKSGKWKLQVELEPGSQLQFRYRATTGDESWWDNEPTAEREVPNPFGGTDSWIEC